MPAIARWDCTRRAARDAFARPATSTSVEDFDAADEIELARQADASATGTSDFRTVARRVMNFARDDASQHAMRAPAVKSPNRNPGGIAETPGFVAETPSDCRLRCRNPTLNGGGFGNPGFRSW